MGRRGERVDERVGKMGGVRKVMVRGGEGRGRVVVRGVDWEGMGEEKGGL